MCQGRDQEKGDSTMAMNLDAFPTGVYYITSGCTNSSLQATNSTVMLTGASVVLLKRVAQSMLPL